MPKIKTTPLGWKDIVSIIGTLAGIGGLLVLAFNESYQRPSAIIALVSLSVISLSVGVIRFASKIIWLYKELRVVIDATKAEQLGALNMKRKWLRAMEEQMTYKLHSSHVGVKYITKDGKKVIFFKEQKIVATKDGITQVADSELKATGQINWNTFKSHPGTPQIDTKKDFGGTFEVMTILAEALPVNKVRKRTMNVEMVDSFVNEQENLSLWISVPTKVASMSVEVPEDAEIIDPKGVVMFGKYIDNVSLQPTKDKKNEVVWDITSPQIGEKYILTWRVR